MKKIFIIIPILVLLLSCSDDENNNDSNGSIIMGEGSYVINGNETPINYAYWYGGISREATFSLTNVVLNNQDEVWNNSSDFIFFDLRPQETQTVSSGTYEFSTSGGIPKYIQDGGHKSDEFTGGTITITQNGTNYSVSFNVSLQSGNNIIGNYNGAINFVE